MQISELHIQAVRNLIDISLTCHARFNIFYGENGSGKTSILESIHILGLNRSFRHHLIDSVINHGADRLSIFARGHDEQENKYQLGLEKDRSGKTLIRCNTETVASSAVLAEKLPLQLIHPASDELITGSPKLRRQFLDWGTFHVEPTFFPLWKKLQKVLKQRNAALKQGLPRDQVTLWDEEYVNVCEAIVALRQAYIAALQPFFNEITHHFLPSHQITLSYQKGWPEKSPLLDLLEKTFYRDAQLGYTSYGPQRDELLLHCQQALAAETLSRGEQKLVIIALRLAQGKLLRALTERQCVYLLDDYAAELDQNHRHKVIEILTAWDAQVFLTTIDYKNIKNELNFVLHQAFHVEQGRVKPL